MDSSAMAESDASAAPPAVPSPSSSSKENLAPLTSRIEELKESKADLLSRIQGLKKDLQDWRSKLDTQVKTYREDGFSRIFKRRAKSHGLSGAGVVWVRYILKNCMWRYGVDRHAWEEKKMQQKQHKKKKKIGRK